MVAGMAEAGQRCDFGSFQGYPNYFDDKWLDNSPTFLGLPALHIVIFF
jgi:hypothetical protein